MRHVTTILRSVLTDILIETVILVTFARFWYVLPEVGAVGPKHVRAT
jgi:hypothetical protein